jgi:hypothetical protein
MTKVISLKRRNLITNFRLQARVANHYRKRGVDHSRPQSHSLKIRLWVRRPKGEIWLASQRNEVEQFLLGKIILSTYVNANTSFLRNTSLWKLLWVLKCPNSRARALETTASFLALPVPYVPGLREDARGREALGTRMGVDLIQFPDSSQV